MEPPPSGSPAGGRRSSTLSTGDARRAGHLRLSAFTILDVTAPARSRAAADSRRPARTCGRQDRLHAVLNERASSSPTHDHSARHPQLSGYVTGRRTRPGASGSATVPDDARLATSARAWPRSGSGPPSGDISPGERDGDQSPPHVRMTGFFELAERCARSRISYVGSSAGSCTSGGAAGTCGTAARCGCRRARAVGSASTGRRRA